MARSRFDFVTLILVIVNVVYFAYNYMQNGMNLIRGSVTSDQLLKVGAMNGHTAPVSWVTSMFQHASGTHILMNMLSLVALAPMVVILFDRFSYLIGYMVSGLVGSIANMMFMPDTVTVGASGAICGMMGMVVAGALFSAKRQYVDLKDAVMSVGFMVVSTLANPHISITAHFGGLIGGFIIGIILLMIKGLFNNNRMNQQEEY